METSNGRRHETEFENDLYRNKREREREEREREREREREMCMEASELTRTIQSRY